MSENENKNIDRIDEANEVQKKNSRLSRVLKILQKILNYTTVILVLIAVLVGVALHVQIYLHNRRGGIVDTETSPGGQYTITFMSEKLGYWERAVSIECKCGTNYKTFQTSIKNGLSPLTEDNWEVEWQDDGYVTITLKGKKQNDEKITFKYKVQ